MSQKQFSSFENLVNLFTSLGKKFTAGNNLLKDTVGWTGKNFLPNTNGTQIVGGVTFTVNSDNSISVIGTPDSGENPRYEIAHISLPIGEYKISGDDKSISPISNGFIGIIKNGTGSYICGTQGSGITDILEVTSTSDVYYVYVRMANRNTAYNALFKPMLRKSDIADDTYEPYHTSVDSNITGLIQNKNILGAKNLLPIIAESADIFTVNTDGSVTINGTGATGVSGIDLGQCTPKSGRYIISSGNVVPGVGIAVQGFTGNIWSKNIIVTESGESTFDIDYDGYDKINVRLRVLEGVSVNNQTFYPMLRLASDPDDTYAPYAKTNKELTDGIQQIYKDNEILGAKNLLPIEIGSRTVQSVVFTVNEDGSITANGTASPNAVILNLCTNLFVKKGKYILSGCPIGASVSTYELLINVGTTTYRDYGEGIEITFDTDTIIDNARIIVRQYATISNQTFYPMLRLASDPDDTYQPYTKTNKELTDGITQIYKDNGLLGAKNLLPNNASTQTINGVTFTVNADGSIMVNGTASADSSLLLVLSEDNLRLPVGKYVLTKGGSLTGIGVLIDAYNGTTWVKTFANSATAESVEFFNDNIGYDRIRARAFITKDTIANNVTLYPMLRLASDSDDTYVPYTKTNKELADSIKQIYKENGLLGAKNLLRYPYTHTTKTNKGITFTDNGDGTITLNGTATEDADFYLINSQLSWYESFRQQMLQYEDLILSGGVSDKVYLSIWNIDGNGAMVQSKGTEASFKFTNDSASFNGVLWVKSGETVTNLVIKPMIRLASDPNSIWQPWAMTNRDLTKAVQSGGSGGAVIDDTTTANDKVWSSSKTKNYTDTAIADAITNALTASY